MQKPYDTLGVPLSANDDTIKAAYLSKVREHPPESSPEMFQLIRSAFELIQTEHKRAEHTLFCIPEFDIDALWSDYCRPCIVQRPSAQQLLDVLRDSI